MSDLDRRPQGFSGSTGGAGTSNVDDPWGDETSNTQNQGESSGYKGTSYGGSDNRQQGHYSSENRPRGARGYRGNRRRGQFKNYGDNTHENNRTYQSHGEHDEEQWGFRKNETNEDRNVENRRQNQRTNDAYQNQQRYHNEGNRDDRQQRYHNEGRQQRYHNEGRRDENPQRYNRDEHQQRYNNEGNRDERQQRYHNEGHKDEHQQRYRNEEHKDEHHEVKEDSYNEGRGRGRYRGRGNRRGGYNNNYRGRPYTSHDQVRNQETSKEHSTEHQTEERPSTSNQEHNYYGDRPRNNERRNQRRGNRGGYNRDSRQHESHEDKPHENWGESEPQQHYKPKPEISSTKQSPTFTQVGSLEPELRGFNIKCKAASEPYQVQVKTRSNTFTAWEVLVGDETGCIKLQLPHEEVARTIRTNSSIFVRNGIILMREESFMILLINKWGKVEVSSTDFAFQVNKGNNMSEVEYERTS
mmetsp:Transcript_17931/g.17924  ORF Transcript_17931/g.17924 Transcript_17931/m.17924 type:complete len:469 (+) Transcript_17931:8-1414(+)